MWVTQNFVQESKFFGNPNILLSKPTKKSNAAYHFPLPPSKENKCAEINSHNLSIFCGESFICGE
jgi:hypothetical protein